jgi:hypothetical protein
LFGLRDFLFEELLGDIWYIDCLVFLLPLLALIVLEIKMLFLAVRLESKFFLLFFRPRRLVRLGLPIDFLPYFRPLLSLSFGVIFAVLVSGVQGCCRWWAYREVAVVPRLTLVPPFF